MSNQHCTIRTNYFRVKDKDAFLDLMNHTQGSENTIDVFEKNECGETYFCFGCYSGISGVDDDYYLRANGIDPEDDKDYDEDDFNNSRYDIFIDRLRELVAEDDAIIIQESGNEKLKYLVGSALIITKDDDKYLSMQTFAEKEAARMIGNPDWTTVMEY